MPIIVVDSDGNQYVCNVLVATANVGVTHVGNGVVRIAGPAAGSTTGSGSASGSAAPTGTGSASGSASGS